jgi:hypothetical protein
MVFGIPEIVDKFLCSTVSRKISTVSRKPIFFTVPHLNQLLIKHSSQTNFREKQNLI